MTLPLEGVRVADFSWVGAGPLTTRLLALYGADVIKVESNAKVDGLRLSPPFRDGTRGVNRSGYFADRNPDKRSVLINLKEPEGRALAKLLVSKSDIVANNFTPGTMERFGLGWDDLRLEHPWLIHLNMSMHGSTGPLRDQLGYGLTIGAASSLHHLCGRADRPPVGTGTNYPDHIPNPTHAAVAVLAAVIHQRRTGQGQLIDLAQTEPMISVLGVGFVEHFANGVDPGPGDNAHPALTPHGVYPCADDRWVALSISSDAEWQLLRTNLDLRDAEDWRTARGRRARRRVIDEEIGRATLSHPADELADRLSAAGLAVGVVRDARELVTSHPQLQHRRHWASPGHAEMGASIYNEAPFRLSRTPGPIRGAAPLLGEHTHEICREILDLDDEQIQALTEAKVLW